MMKNMIEDKIDRNMVDLALINIVNTFGYDPNNWHHGYEKKVSIAEKREMLHRISSALCLVDSDIFNEIRDKIEAEYNIRNQQAGVKTPTLTLDHSIEDRPIDMHPFKHEYFQAVLAQKNGLRIWYGKHGLTLEVKATGEKAQLTWSDNYES